MGIKNLYQVSVCLLELFILELTRIAGPARPLPRQHQGGRDQEPIRPQSCYRRIHVAVLLPRRGPQ